MLNYNQSFNIMIMGKYMAHILKIYKAKTIIEAYL